MDAVDVLKKAGIKLFQKVGSLRHALHAQELGYDGVYAAGFEEGGHPLGDDVTSIVLTAKLVESLRIPVVTAGGIGNGRTMAAALALGAQGVMMASRFVATEECEIHDNIKQELVCRQETDTVIYGKSLNLQGRSLKTKHMEKFLDIEKKGGGFDDLVPLLAGKIGKAAQAAGQIDSAHLGVGQSIGLIQDVPTCRVLLDRMAEEAHESLRKALLCCS